MRGAGISCGAHGIAYTDKIGEHALNRMALAQVNVLQRRGMYYDVRLDTTHRCVQTATVAYIPHRRLAGLGTIAKVVDAYAHRLALQEQIGEAIVRTLRHELEPHAALCILSMTHGCLVGRGERKTGAVVETMAIEGEYRHKTDLLTAIRAITRRP